MGRSFNVNADCKPKLHYMVNIESKLEKIKGMIDKNEYFEINLFMWNVSSYFFLKNFGVDDI